MKKRIQVLIAAIVLLLAGSAAFAQKTARLKFAKGATSVVASGRLNGYRDKKVFVLRLRRGQTLTTEQDKSDSSLHYVTVFIKNPGGAEVGDSDASCNNRREIAPTEAGDYRITVVECKKADPWRGKFKLLITVK